MIATFNNRFELIENAYDSPRIHYKQTLRADMKVFIDYAPEGGNGKDWTITIEGDKSTIEKFKGSVIMELTLYLRQRTKKKHDQLDFLQIQELAERRSIE